MYKIRKKDLKKASLILAHAYQEYPTIVFLFPKEKKRKKFLKDYFKLYVFLRYKYGELYATSSRLEGIIGWSNSEKSLLILKQLLYRGFLLILRYRRKIFNKFFSLKSIYTENKIGYMLGSYWILGPFGVEQNHRKNGYGKKLLRFACKQADENKKAFYSQTHQEHTKVLFSTLGFKLVEENEIPNTSIRQWSMVRNPI